MSSFIAEEKSEFIIFQSIAHFPRLEMQSIHSYLFWMKVLLTGKFTTLVKMLRKLFQKLMCFFCRFKHHLSSFFSPECVLSWLLELVNYRSRNCNYLATLIKRRGWGKHAILTCLSYLVKNNLLIMLVANVWNTSISEHLCFSLI